MKIDLHTTCCVVPGGPTRESTDSSVAVPNRNALKTQSARTSATIFHQSSNFLDGIKLIGGGEYTARAEL